MTKVGFDLQDAVITCSHCGEEMEPCLLAGIQYYQDKNGHYPGQVFYVTPDGTETRVKDIDREKVTIIGQVTIMRKDDEERRIGTEAKAVR